MTELNIESFSLIFFKMSDLMLNNGYIGFNNVPQVGISKYDIQINAKVEIFDIYGRIIDEIPGGDQIWQPINSIGSGVYLIHANFGDKWVPKKKVVYLK